MSDKMIIQHLLSGLNPDFKKELSRRQPTIQSLNEFLKYAKIEQDLHDTFDKSYHLSLESQQSIPENHSSLVPPLATAVEPKQQQFRYKPHTKPKSSDNKRKLRPVNRQNQRFRIPRKDNKPNPTTMNTSNQTLNCKVCGRKNHRTIDCFHKQKNGCFNCDQDHLVRDCKSLPNFQ
jgi:hypothetical protein